MITKDQLENTNTNNSNPLEEIQKDKIQQLKALFPNVIDSDGNLNYSALKEEISQKRIVNNTQGYELTFAGKGLARTLADEPTTKELQISEKQSKYFDKDAKKWEIDTTGKIGNSQNTVIRGDNIDALKILNANYHNKIKMIYIDPPYNTTSENFVYKDNFKETEQDLIEKYGLGEYNINFLDNVYGTRSHSGWLSFMYPRLKLAKELLTDDGVIFISIDDNEQANLKILCDEIFGEENATTPIIWGKGNAQNDAIGVQKNHETILCYMKQPIKLLEDSYQEKTVFTDKLGTFYLGSGLTTGADGGTLNKRPNLGYSIYLNNDTNDFIAVSDYDKEKALTSNDVTKVYTDDTSLITKGYSQIIRPPKKDNMLGRWTWKIETFNEKKDLIHIDKNGSIKQKKYFDDLPINNNKVKVKTQLPHKSIKNIASSLGTSYLKNLFDSKKVFNNPKPINLISGLIKVATTNDDNDIILDFFAGSGTTGDAVMQLNAEDGGNRKYILCQWDEQINQQKSPEPYNFCTENNFKPVISSITIERLNLSGNKLIENQKSQDQDLYKQQTHDKPLDIGYNVFTLTNKTTIHNNENNQLELYNKDHRTNPLNTLYNMLTSTGKPLNTPITEIEKNTLYKIANEFYLINNINIPTLTQTPTLTTTTLNIDAYSPTLTLQTLLNLQQHIENLKVVY